MPTRWFDAIFIDFYGTICAGDREAVEAVCQRIVDSCELPLTARELAITWGERFFAWLDRCHRESFRTLYECELESLQETIGGDPEFLTELIDTFLEDAPQLLADMGQAVEQDD